MHIVCIRLSLIWNFLKKLLEHPPHVLFYGLVQFKSLLKNTQSYFAKVTSLYFQLVAVLREVKYLETQETQEIPSSASSIFARNDTFFQYVANLDLTVKWYNKVRTTVLEVEFPLIENQLQEIDAQLEKAEKSLNWNSDGKYMAN